MKSSLVYLVLAVLVIASVFACAKYLDSASRQRDTSIYVTVAIPAGGGFNPKEIHARVGQTARLQLTSKDVSHEFVLPAFNVSSGPLTVGRFTSVEFVPDKAGEFPFYDRAHSNGDNSEPGGRLIVEP